MHAVFIQDKTSSESNEELGKYHFENTILSQFSSSTWNFTLNPFFFESLSLQ